MKAVGVFLLLAIAQESALQTKILAKERQGLDCLKTGNLAEFAALTADDAVFVDPHGPASKAQVIKNTSEFRLDDYMIEDVKFVPLSSKSGLIGYKLSESGTSHGRQFKANVYVSSIWAERKGKWLCLFSQETAARSATPAATALGLFESHADVGTVLNAGSVDYDAANRTYTVAGSGENMWFGSDAFQYVWKKVSGDVTLTADVSFIGTGKEAHRKAVLMIRQSLDADSAHADVARHGDGLTSLQARDEKGANTSEIQSATKAPARVRIAKRGDYFYIWVAGEGEELQFSGGSMRVPLHDPFYVGIGVCSHNKDVVEKAVFSNVELTVGSPTEATPPKLYSTLETVPVSGDRRVVYVTPGRLSAPMWTADGAALIFHRDSHMERIPAAGGKPEVIETSAAGHEEQPLAGLPSDGFYNCLPHLSPDGQQVAFLSFAGDQAAIPEDKDVLLRVMSVKDGKVRVLAKLVGGKGTMDAPSWSPDSRRLAFVSYQWIQ